MSLQSIVSDSYRKRVKRDSQRTDPCCVEAEENSEHLGHQFCTFQKFPLFPHFLLETNVCVNDTFRNRVPHLLHFQLLILVNYFHIPIIPTFPEFHKKYPPPPQKKGDVLTVPVYLLLPLFSTESKHSDFNMFSLFRTFLKVVVTNPFIFTIKSTN